VNLQVLVQSRWALCDVIQLHIVKETRIAAFCQSWRESHTHSSMAADIYLSVTVLAVPFPNHDQGLAQAMRRHILLLGIEELREYRPRIHARIGKCETVRVGYRTNQCPHCRPQSCFDCTDFARTSSCSLQHHTVLVLWNPKFWIAKYLGSCMGATANGSVATWCVGICKSCKATYQGCMHSYMMHPRTTICHAWSCTWHAPRSFTSMCIAGRYNSMIYNMITIINNIHSSSCLCGWEAQAAECRSIHATGNTIVDVRMHMKYVCWFVSAGR
jgi:hypothetical protein